MIAVKESIYDATNSNGLSQRTEEISTREPSEEELIERLRGFETRHPTATTGPSLMSPERIRAVKERVLSNIKEFCYEFRPKGRLSSKEGYWEVPHPDLIKISLSTGNLFSLENRKLRNPLGDIFGLWTYLTGQDKFRRIVIELEEWCRKVEGRQTEWQRNDGFDDREVKDYVSMFLLDSGREPVIRGTGRSLWKLLKTRMELKDLPLEIGPTELQKPTSFLRVLKQWAITGDREFFTLTMKSRKKATEFILTVSKPTVRRRFS